MSGWGGGYVTDIPYTVGYYPQQSPVMAALGATIGGVAAPIPTGDDPVMMLELGCGYGYGAMALAASNPNWTITAVDFNPAHIASARSWAAEAGLTNVTFVEGDFTRWEEHPVLRGLPEQDFVTMHGIWSWIPPVAQRGIVRMLAEKVRPGGLVHVSYNTMPGWVDMVGPARLIREAGNRTAGRSDQQARAGMDLIRDLAKAEAHFLHNRPGFTVRMDMLEKAPSSYLAHEFMNTQWAPCFMMDVANAFSEAKLEWVASSELTDNFPELTMSEAQREIFHRYGDPLMQELIKDICSPRSLRHDIYVRGARRIGGLERTETLMDVSLTLVKRPEDLPEDVQAPAGRAELNKEFYQPIVQALSTRPGRVRDLLALPSVVGRRDNPAELISILIAADMVEPTLRPMTAPGAEAMRFNAVTATRMSRTESPNRGVSAACRPTGTPVIVPLLAMVLVNHIRSGITDLDGLVRALAAPPDQEAEARSSVIACLERFIPMMKNAGVV